MKEISDAVLFAAALLKVALYTGIGIGLAILAIARYVWPNL